MGKPQKIKVFANANSMGLEREMNAWLRNGSPPPVIQDIQMAGWGESGGTGQYTIVAVVIYE